jgi:hypothetical protein
VSKEMTNILPVHILHGYYFMACRGDQHIRSYMCRPYLPEGDVAAKLIA